MNNIDETVRKMLVSPYDVDLNNVKNKKFNGFYTEESLNKVKDFAAENNIVIVLDFHGDNSMFGNFSYVISKDYILCCEIDQDLDMYFGNKDEIYSNHYENMDKIKDLREKENLTQEEYNILYWEDCYNILESYLKCKNKIEEEENNNSKIYYIHCW